MPPLIDPGAIVLSSPFFVTKCNVIRRATTVNEKGRPSYSVTRFNNTPCVEDWEVRNRYNRDKDKTSGSKGIGIYCRFRLQSAVNGNEPDIVQWRGSMYQVIEVDDCTEYGAGWVEAYCTATDFQDPPAGQP